ncbi:hypothetical protein LTR65_009527 [Meristemomyces frigidus]
MWSFNPDLRHFVFTACTLLLTRPQPTWAQDGCFPLQQPLVQRVVYEQAVSIRTDVLLNTTFYPVPGVAVTVDNAPTSFDGVTTFRYTDPQTVSATEPGVSRTSSSTPTTPTFALNAGSSNQDGRMIHGKRQSGSTYISANGTVTNDCTTAPVYAINNGGLTATVNGTVYTYSTSPGLPYAMFAPSTIPGSITTTFTLTGSGGLSWIDAAFYNGEASFCMLQNGTVYAVFQQNAQPNGCLYVVFTLFSVSSCQALSFATITGPSG